MGNDFNNYFNLIGKRSVNEITLLFINYLNNRVLPWSDKSLYDVCLETFKTGDVTAQYEEKKLV